MTNNTMNYKKLILILLGILIILVIVDILTGIFYWNRVNLVFDSNIFNNITSPIVGIVALVVYSLALGLTYKQNQIIQSQHLKPYFEKEIDTVYKKHEDIKFKIDLIETEYEECNGLNFTTLIMEQLSALTKDRNYQEDINSYDKGIKFTREYIMGRSYMGIVMFLSGFTVGFSLKLDYDYLLELANEIEESKLLDVDKEQLKRRVRKEIVGNYLSYVEFETTGKIHIPEIPMLFDFELIKGGDLTFKRITETSFSDSYELLKLKYK